VKAKQKAGILIYSIGDTTGFRGVEAYHLLKTANGGQFQLQWTDGSKVWLNAGSSVKYPVQFSGNLRKVQLIGEAYFEIEKNAQKPFIVEAGRTSISVLGTHFNVHAYPDEKTIRVSLAEGIVKINDGEALLPGELAIIDSSGMVTKSKADLDAELAWKNGLFVFKGSNINEVMLQISRWYDVEFVVNHAVTDHFNAVFPRDKPVSTLLHLLEGTGNVHFKIEGKKIFVK
jgi:transmembrane sensor